MPCAAPTSRQVPPGGTSAGSSRSSSSKNGIAGISRVPTAVVRRARRRLDPCGAAGGACGANGLVQRGGDVIAERTGVTDTRGRHLRDLRISVTDRCNFRCTYCMPREVFGPDFTFLDRSQLLSFEEITRIVRVAADLGVHKVRLTGGEPLLRRDIDTLVASVAAVDGIEDLALTTNGSLLPGLADRLR